MQNNNKDKRLILSCVETSRLLFTNNLSFWDLKHILDSSHNFIFKQLKKNKIPKSRKLRSISIEKSLENKIGK